MIPVILIASAIIGAATAVGLTVCFWDEIKLFLKETWEELKNHTTLFIKGCQVFLRKIKRGITTAVKAIATYYVKTNQHWEKVSFTELIEENEIPAKLLDQVCLDKDLDVTDELELQLY